MQCSWCDLVVCSFKVAALFLLCSNLGTFWARRLLPYVNRRCSSRELCPFPFCAFFVCFRITSGHDCSTALMPLFKGVTYANHNKICESLNDFPTLQCAQTSFFYFAYVGALRGQALHVPDFFFFFATPFYYLKRTAVKSARSSRNNKVDT